MYTAKDARYGVRCTSYTCTAHDVRCPDVRLKPRATRIAKALNELPGVSCNPAEGAMYLFPSLELPAKAVAAAETKGMSPDEFYCIRLLEATGLVVVPGSGFRQVEGTHHFRTTFLPPDDMLDDVLPKLAGFQAAFMKEFA